MSLNLQRLSAVLQARIDALTEGDDEKKLLLLAKAIEVSVGSVALSDLAQAGDAQVLRIDAEGLARVQAVIGAGTAQVDRVDERGMARLAELQAFWEQISSGTPEVAETLAQVAAARADAINVALQGLSPYVPAWAPTFADAQALAVTLPEGTPIIIGADERHAGRRTLNRAAHAGGDSLSLDFTTGSYAVEEIVEFLSYITLQLVDIPASSTAPGFPGAVALDATHFYVATGTDSWKRLPLETF